jgi:hypothetical protein
MPRTAEYMGGPGRAWRTSETEAAPNAVDEIHDLPLAAAKFAQWSCLHHAALMACYCTSIPANTPALPAALVKSK